MKVHCRVRKNPSLIPILSQINPVHSRSACSSEIHFNIVVCLRIGLMSGLFFSGFPSKILCTFHQIHEKKEFKLDLIVWKMCERQMFYLLTSYTKFETFIDSLFLLHNKRSRTCGLVHQGQWRHDQHPYRIKGARRCIKSYAETRRLHIHQLFWIVRFLSSGNLSFKTETKVKNFSCFPCHQWRNFIADLCPYRQRGLKLQACILVFWYAICRTLGFW
jgi:hypothetical protein